MDQNPYESPRHAAEELPPPTGSDVATWLWSIIMSFAVVFISGVATLLLSPAIGDAQQLPALVTLCALGLAYVCAVIAVALSIGRDSVARSSGFRWRVSALCVRLTDTQRTHDLTNRML